MPDHDRTKPPLPDVSKDEIEEADGTVTPARLPDSGVADVAREGKPTGSRELTADEQMAMYEEDLKENDWGHQPC